jgi:hypothetical protein
MANDYGPSIRVTKLYRKTSKNGATYFAGRWGGAKVALLKTNETGNDGEEIWNLVLSEAPAYKPDEKPAVSAPSGAPARYVPRTLDDDAIPFAPETR